MVDQYPLSSIHASWGRVSWNPRLALYDWKPTSDATEYRVILNDRPKQRLWLPRDEIECIAHHTHTATKDTIPNHKLSETQTSNLLLTRWRHPRYYPLPSATSQIATRTVTATHINVSTTVYLSTIIYASTIVYVSIIFYVSIIVYVICINHVL